MINKWPFLDLFFDIKSVDLTISHPDGQDTHRRSSDKSEMISGYIIKKLDK